MLMRYRHAYPPLHFVNPQLFIGGIYGDQGGHKKNIIEFILPSRDKERDFGGIGETCARDYLRASLKEGQSGELY